MHTRAYALPRHLSTPLAALLIAGLALAMLAVAAPGASADHTKVRKITFPVAGPYGDRVHYSDTYYASRSSGNHAATDIMAPKLRPVHAAKAGVVTWAPYPEPSYGWMLSIENKDGFTYHYVHLNNDNKGSDDGKGGVYKAYSEKIAKAAKQKGSSLNKSDGVRVKRGELIGYVGDSGNAESTGSHLHFEMERSDGHMWNPYESLRAAQRRGDVPGADSGDDSSTTSEEDDGADSVPEGWTYADVDPDSTHGQAVTDITDAGITEGCATDRYCPDVAMTRETMAVFIARALGLDDVDEQQFDDVGPKHPAFGEINAVAEADIVAGYGDGHFRPARDVTRAQMATFVGRALDLDEIPGQRFDDVEVTDPHAGWINAIAEEGVTSGCVDDDHYCPGTDIPRDQMATFLATGFDL